MTGRERTFTSGCERHTDGLSRLYVAAAWITLAAAVFLWEPFVGPAVGFMFGGFLLRRDGL